MSDGPAQPDNEDDVLAQWNKMMQDQRFRAEYEAWLDKLEKELKDESPD